MFSRSLIQKYMLKTESLISKIDEANFTVIPFEGFSKSWTTIVKEIEDLDLGDAFQRIVGRLSYAEDEKASTACAALKAFIKKNKLNDDQAKTAQVYAFVSAICGRIENILSVLTDGVNFEPLRAASPKAYLDSYIDVWYSKLSKREQATICLLASNAFRFTETYSKLSNMSSIIRDKADEIIELIRKTKIIDAFNQAFALRIIFSLASVLRNLAARQEKEKGLAKVLTIKRYARLPISFNFADESFLANYCQRLATEIKDAGINDEEMKYIAYSTFYVLASQTENYSMLPTVNKIFAKDYGDITQQELFDLIRKLSQQK